MRIPHLWRTLGLALLGLCPAANAAVVNISTAHDYAAPANITASASTQLTGLCSLATMRAQTAANLYVYSFETWPETTSSLGSNSYTFKFDETGDGVDDQQVTVTYTGSFSSTTQLGQSTNASASSPSTYLGGLGDIGWGSSYADHTIAFQHPVSAAGVVYRSASSFYLKKAVYNANNFPVSYTLSDGTVVNLGTAGIAGATIAAGTNTFVGVLDSTGKGIISITFRIMGSVGGASQYSYIDDLAFVEMPEPAVAAVANLRARHDFAAPTNITASASTQLAGLCSLADFRDLAGYNKAVYSFTTWPQATSDLGANTFPFKFDLNGDGTEDQRVTVTYTGSYSSTTHLGKSTNSSASSPSSYLGGLGDIGWGGSTYALHTFAFQKPVSACGFVYRSASNMYLKKVMYNANDYPVSYTLSDGTVMNLGTSGVSGATITANTNTFVGVIDTSGKGIISFTARVQGSAGSSSQYAYIDDLAFVMAGPPPGTWSLVLNDDFTGTALNTAVWSKGYRFHDIINNELQGYVPENVTVANGLCTIKIEKRDCRSTDMYGVQDDVVQHYASGALQTYSKFAQAYGYFEARIRMPNAPGTWPAFWMTPDRGPSYTDVGQRTTLGNGGGTLSMGNEIDITEFMSAWAVNGLFTSHSGYFWNYSGSGAWGAYAKTNDGNGGQYYYPNADTQFHTYGVYWAPGKYIWYIDGKVVLRRDDPTYIASAPGNLILNCALSTNFWVRTGTISEIDAGLATPKYMDIDYVKVWSGTIDP